MTMKSSLESHTLSIVKQVSETDKIYVGFSGGVDSLVLLNVLVQCQQDIKQEIIAIHVNHRLNKHSDNWAQHCQNICNGLNIKLIQVELDANSPKGESQEQWSRDLRYDAIINQIGNEDIFMTAHHKDDLAETLLLQLFRGAGPAGLSAIPEKIRLGKGWHVRPFLKFTRQQIMDYVSRTDLEWIDDESNLDERFDRNYLRHKVMPLIERKWPGILKTLSRSARIQSDVNGLLEDLARIDLENCINLENATLLQDCMNSLSDSRAINVIRFWLKTKGHRSPSATNLVQILTDVINSDSDASPCINIDNAQIRRYRNMIYLTDNLPNPTHANSEINWDTVNECAVLFGRLNAKKHIGPGISLNKIAGKVFNIRYRNGHEKMKLGGHHHSLKNIFQEHGIPPCFRGLIPLIYIDNTLVEITGLCINEDFVARSDEDALQIRWDRAKEIYALKTVI